MFVMSWFFFGKHRVRKLLSLVFFGDFLHPLPIIAAVFNIRMIIVKVRQHRQGGPLTEINLLPIAFHSPLAIPSRRAFIRKFCR